MLLTMVCDNLALVIMGLFFYKLLDMYKAHQFENAILVTIGLNTRTVLI